MKEKIVRKGFNIIISFFVCLSVIMSMVCISFAVNGDKIGEKDYTITNPYKSVDWDTWSAYKGATHVHTVRSDGNVELDEMVEEYYSLGYQALALTDHGTVNYSWTKDQARLAIFGYQYFVHGNIDEITDARYQQITTGSDRNGNGMTEVPLGIELNGSSTSKCHVNSYFADCGHGDLEISATWPEDAIKKSQNAGGICHINHVGEWTDGKDNIGTYDSAFVAKFSKLFVDYSSCIGMELVNTSDNRTHNDRYLYDESLKITAAQGTNILGFCEDDSHDLSDCGKNAQYFMMPSNTQENIRTSMENGAFFACSKNAKTADELGDGFAATGDFPMVSRINVDESKDQISISAYNGAVIKMVADGKVVAEKEIMTDNQIITFDLNEYEDSINSYVRFYITGAGGICYVQPFLLTSTDYSTSTVKFLPNISGTSLSVTDADGTVLNAVNDENYYVLPQGEYSYTASASGYETVKGSFSVTQDDIALGKQTKIDIPMIKIMIFSRDTTKTTVDTENKFIFGLKPGITSLNSYISVASGCKLTNTPSLHGFGTGTVATVKSAAGDTVNYTLVIFGDVDGNGYYDGQDAFLVSMIITGMLKQENLSPAQWFAADCNHDKVIDENDYNILCDAGVLLATIQQNETTATTSSVYNEYVGLILQNVEDESDMSDDVSSDEEDNTDNNDENKVVSFSKRILLAVKAVFDYILNIIK